MNQKDLLYAFNDLEEELIPDPIPVLPVRRRSLTVLMAAAIISCLIFTAYAASEGSMWFQNFFAGQAGRELSQGQKAYVSASTAQFQQSQSVGGYTFTLESALSDGRFCYLQFRLTAPEGAMLDADSYSDIHDTVFLSDTGLRLAGSWEVMDEDRTDNQATLLCDIGVIWGQGNSLDFTAHPWKLYIYGLQAGYVKNPGTTDMYIRYEPLTEGAWCFDITFPEGASQTLELIDTPVVCSGMANYGVRGLHEDTVEITSFKLRALSAELTFRLPQDEEARINGRFGDIYVVMKNGERIRMQEYSNVPNQVTYQFDAPVVLAEADHILLPNGSALPCPAE